MIRPLYAFAKCDFPSIIQDNFFKCNYFMCKFAPKMQGLDDMGFNMLPYGVGWGAVRVESTMYYGEALQNLLNAHVTYWNSTSIVLATDGEL